DFGARLLVDEAHALGVAGPEGAGTAAATGVRPDLIMGTFSKSLASCGGFIAGPRAVIEFMKITCRPLMFTASGVPAALGAALEAARIARAEDWRREAVAARAEQLRSGLAQLGFQVPDRTVGPIVAVQVGDNWDAGLLWKALLDHGVYTNCAIPPAVPRAMLRTSVMATHTEADIDRALTGFEEARADGAGA
ncbi:MAG TPA: aminotransferase class I/II-fold pyridoxal phosphate-dependent enzyme, partial [Acidimicrobiales bacterium]